MSKLGEKITEKVADKLTRAIYWGPMVASLQRAKDMGYTRADVMASVIPHFGDGSSDGDTAERLTRGLLLDALNQVFPEEVQ